MKKYIAILGPLGLPIPPSRQGGIEWMVYYLIEGLVKRGYKVLSLAPKTSKSSAKLIPVCNWPLADWPIDENVEASRRLRTELSILSNIKIELAKHQKEIGLIFNHTVDGGVLADLEKNLQIPSFHITHLPLYQELAELYRHFQTRLITISESQKKGFPGLHYSANIYNGIDLKLFPFSKKAKNYFLFAGKIREGKNPLTAIQASKALGQKLIIVGKINNKSYFEKQIKKELGGKIDYKGEVPFGQLKKLYIGAKALLFPIKWPEPFGLVMIESMACGAPVIAFDQGSVREVILPGKTGFIVKNKTGMIAAMKKIDQIDRKECRNWVENKFSVEKMIDQYEKICQKHL